MGLPIGLTLSAAGLGRLGEAAPISRELGEEMVRRLEPELGLTVDGALRLLLSEASGPCR